MRSLPIACCACCALVLPLVPTMAQNSVKKSRIVGVVGDSVNESVFIDGFEWRDLKAGDLDMIVNPDDVIGLEVYQPYDAPAQFQRFDRGCLTLMVWRQVRSKVKQ